MISCFTLLDNPCVSFAVTFIDQSGTNKSACARRFFADIPERCENGKELSLVVGPWSLALGHRVCGDASTLLGGFFRKLLVGRALRCLAKGQRPMGTEQ